MKEKWELKAKNEFLKTRVNIFYTFSLRKNLHRWKSKVEVKYGKGLQCFI